MIKLLPKKIKTSDSRKIHDAVHSLNLYNLKNLDNAAFLNYHNPNNIEEIEQVEYGVLHELSVWSDDFNKGLYKHGDNLFYYYNALCNIMWRNEKYEAAIYYENFALIYAVEIENTDKWKYIQYCLSNLAELYSNSTYIENGSTYVKLDKKQEILDYLESCAEKDKLLFAKQKFELNQTDIDLVSGDLNIGKKRIDAILDSNNLNKYFPSYRLQIENLAYKKLVRLYDNWLIDSVSKLKAVTGKQSTEIGLRNEYINVLRAQSFGIEGLLTVFRNKDKESYDAFMALKLRSEKSLKRNIDTLNFQQKQLDSLNRKYKLSNDTLRIAKESLRI